MTTSTIVQSTSSRVHAAAACQPPTARSSVRRSDEETRRAVEAFMREQVEQHAWLIDTDVASMRTWWPYTNLCTAVAELAWTDEPRRGSTWLLAQVDVHELLDAHDAADQLASFQAVTIDENHIPILLECAVQVETRGARRRERPGPP